jgi:hypothetical protein
MSVPLLLAQITLPLSLRLILAVPESLPDSERDPPPREASVARRLRRRTREGGTGGSSAAAFLSMGCARFQFKTVGLVLRTWESAGGNAVGADMTTASGADGMLVWMAREEQVVAASPRTTLESIADVMRKALESSGCDVWAETRENTEGVAGDRPGGGVSGKGYSNGAESVSKGVPMISADGELRCICVVGIIAGGRLDERDRVQ